MKQVFLGVFLLATAMPVDVVTTQAARAADVEGTWSARVYDKDKAGAPVEARLQLQMNIDDDRERNWSNWGQSVRVSEFVNLPANLDTEQDVQFELRRDAGVVAFNGRFERGRGVGHLAFTANREFARALAQQSNDTPSDRELFSYALVDVSRAFPSELRSMGFGEVSLEEAYKLRIHGTTIDFIKSIRTEYPGVDLDDITKLRIHGVSTSYIAGLRSAGLQNPSLDEVLKFRIHGITPTFVKELKAAGYTNLSEDELVDWAIHGRRLLKSRRR